MVARRAMLVLFDAVSVAISTVLLTLFVVDKAYAYVDPSVMTYTIQALAGVGVALSAVAGVALRKTRKKLLNLFGIDENARKEAEARVHRMDADGKAILTEYDEPEAQKPKGRSAYIGHSEDPAPSSSSTKYGDRPSWRRRFALALLVIGFCGFTLGIVAPFEIVAGGAESLSFGLSDIAVIAFVATAAITALLALLVSLVPGRAFSHVLVFFFCGGLCCYVQALFLNTGLPSADGSAVDFWGEHKSMMIISTAVWLVLLAIPTLLASINRMRAQVLVAVLSVCLIVVQSVGVASLFVAESDEAEAELIQVTEDGLFEVSGENNVIVFVLDRYETGLMNQMIEANPNLLENFTGFTYYSDSLGGMIPTLHAVPHLLTGELPVKEEDIQSYYDERYARSSFIEDMYSSGYSIGIYSTVMGLEYLSEEEKHQEIADLTVNLHGADDTVVNTTGALKALAKCALYRDMPWVLKERFWFYTDEIDQKVISKSNDGDPDNSLYILDDPRFFSRLTNFGLTIEEGDYKGAFRFIHLLGAHSPYTMNEFGQYVGVDGATREQQASGALHIVETYMDMLREMGLYENATIIVMSDHGDWVSSMENPEFPISPIFLLKPAGVSDGVLKVSDTPVSHCDFHATVLEAMGVSGEGYGVSVSEIDNPDRVRETYMITSDGSYCIDLLKYRVSGYALDFSNWAYTGESWRVTDPK